MDRAVVVMGPKGRGSGYTIGPMLVLTSAHVVCGAGTVELYRPGVPGTYLGRVVWRGNGGGRDDAALVAVEDGRWRPPGSPAARWGEFVTALPGQECEAHGVPNVAQPRPRSHTESRQIRGVINPGSGWVGNRYLMTLQEPLPVWTEPDLPWGGMSGAAVLAGDLVIGVVAAEAPHSAHGAVEAVPAYVLHHDASFRAALQAYGADSRTVEPVEFQDLVDHDFDRTAVRNGLDTPGGTGGPSGSPTALLRAEQEVVGFHGRTELLAGLADWCGRPGVDALLVHGPGGQGKTRLLRELGRRLSEDPGDPDEGGWVVVWLRATAPPAGLDRLRAAERPLLVVVDYAESRSRQVAQLLESVRARRTPLKLVLLARTAGPWWEQAQVGTAAAEDVLGNAAELELPPLAGDPADRPGLYRQAVEAFAARLPAPPGDHAQGWPALAARLPAPDLSGAGFENMLTLHMAALADLLDSAASAAQDPAPEPLLLRRPTVPDDVESRLLAHESRYWELTLATRGFRDRAPEIGLFTDALAAATLLGADDHDRADDVLRRVPDLPAHLRRSVSEWIAELYPPTDPATRPWGGLQPDRLAERFVGTHVRRHRHLAPALLSGVDPAEASRLLTLLTRAASHRPLRDDLAPALTRLCTRHPDRLALPAIAVAPQVEVPGPLLDALQELLDAPTTTAQDLADWVRAVPRSSFVLGPWAVRLAERVVASQQARRAEDPDATIALASSLRELSKRLAGIGEPAEALRVGDSAIDLLRSAVETWGPAEPRRAAARNRLAAGLGNRSVFLTRLGHRADALAAAQESVDVYRELETAGEVENRGHLLTALDNLSTCHHELGAVRESLVLAQEVVARRRESARTGDEEAASNLAVGLNNLALRYWGTGRHESALDAGRQAVDLMRPLADRRPDAYRDELAGTLATLATCLGEMGHAPEALQAVQEAVDIRRQLAEGRPAVYQAALARSLNSLSIALNRAGRGTEAVAVAEEAVGLFRTLAASRPTAYLHELARSLHSWGNELADTGEHERALAAATESSEIFGDLYQALPAAYAEDHASALLTLGTRLGNAGRGKEGLELMTRVVSRFRSTAEDRTPSARSHLATCLNNISGELRSADRPADAVPLIEEAVRIGRELAAENPAAFGPHLARYLTTQALCLNEAGRVDESVPVAIEAVAAALPSADQPEWVEMLDVLAGLLLLAGRPAEGAAALEAVVDARRRLARTDPARHEPALLKTLATYGLHLSLTDRADEAAVVAREVLDARRQRWEEERSGTTRAALDRALAQATSLLVQVDGTASLERLQEAVDLHRALVRDDPTTRPAPQDGTPH